MGKSSNGRVFYFFVFFFTFGICMQTDFWPFFGILTFPKLFLFLKNEKQKRLKVFPCSSIKGLIIITVELDFKYRFSSQILWSEQ